MRGWLISITSSTDVMPATAPAETRPAAQPWPMKASAYATGALRNWIDCSCVTIGMPGSAASAARNWMTGTIPVSTAPTAR